MIPDDIILRAKPLFLNDSGRLVLGKGNSLFERTDGGGLQFLVRVPESPIKRLIASSRWIVRIARLGFGAGICFRGIYFFTYGRKIYSFDPKQEQLCHEFTFASGRGPLSFTLIEDIPGFKDGIYFGEYLGNPKRNPVNIYRRDEYGAWNVVFTFSLNQINHVHSLVVDSIRNCVWLLTGDFEHSAAIWVTKDGFCEVTQVVAGQQIYRACVAFPVAEGLLYATDTQKTKNSLRLLTKNNNIWTSKHLLDTNGPCIYGCELHDYFVFSTATEPSDHTRHTLFSMLDCKPGPGVNENKSDVVLIRKINMTANILFSKKKDLMPYRLFQFGAFLFPKGARSDNTLFSYSIGNLTNDLSTEVYNLDACQLDTHSEVVLNVRN
jgi:hypothetical protein